MRHHDHVRTGAREGSPQDIRAKTERVGGDIPLQRGLRGGHQLPDPEDDSWTPLYVSITAASELSFIYRLIEEGHARSESWISSLRGNVEFAEKPMEILAEVLRR